MKLIIAPHPDDEIIGCWRLLREGKVNYVAYVFIDKARENEIFRAMEKYGFKAILIKKFSVEELKEVISRADEVYVPHPYDHHPQHRLVRLMSESVAFELGVKLMYYSTDMNVPWAIEALNYDDAMKKLEDLQECYPSQESEFLVNHHWWLFEGVTPYPTPPIVHVETAFLGYHYFPGSKREYLAKRHQHLFTVKVDVLVNNLNREVEFHDLRDKLQEIISEASYPETASVEMMAKYFWSKLKGLYLTEIRVCVCEEGNLCGCYGDPLW